MKNHLYYRFAGGIRKRIMSHNTEPRAAALDFLNPIDPKYSFVSVGEVLIDASSDDEIGEDVVETFEKVHEWLTDEENPIVDAEQMKQWEMIRSRDDDLGLIEDPAFLEPIVVALYLRAKVALSNSSRGEFFSDLDDSLEDVQRNIDELPSGLFGEVLIETERRANRDREFARTLKKGANELNDLKPYLESLGERASARMVPDDPDGDDCWCEVRGCNSSGHCRDFCIESFWTCAAILVGIILVIVLA
ncbi:hypothetical protein NDI54_13230 [Haloarcula sp. S1AR25-5A]|uniref:Uncharacterized protein n=1 Tax=Haloarcula terrestris TaxID=2950533 RepID=A0AAE4JJT0_9EURY|nr:hypothetical protein [Haloarcula terrestris]MDS0222306.1 hypothetical protein [Haloarcula terrestris]